MNEQPPVKRPDHEHIREKLISVSSQFHISDEERRIRYEKERLANARQGTIYFWILASLFVLVGCLAIYVLWPFNPGQVNGGRASSSATAYSGSDASEYENFQQWPLLKQIDSANSIVLVRFVGTLKEPVVFEMLKQTTNSVVTFKPGDLWTGFDVSPWKNLGSLVLMYAGSSGSPRSMAIVSGDPPMVQGQIPMDVFRELAKQPKEK